MPRLVLPPELRIKTHAPANLSLEYDGADFDLDIAHSDYFAEEKRIQISTRITVGTENPEIEADGSVRGIPFFLNLEVVGIFEVNDSEFPADRIYEWANTNAMYIMYPYLREHVFALTSDVLTRTGEKNIEWLRSLFLDKWLDYNLSTHWRISQLRGVEEMPGIGKSDV